MKVRLLVVLLGMGILPLWLSSCFFDDSHEPGLPLATIDASLRTDFSIDDNWFFLSDEAGHVLDVFHATAPGFINFHGTTTDDSVTVTWLSKTDHLSDVSLQSWVMPARSTFSINRAVIETPGQIGAFTVTIDSISPLVETKITVGAPFFRVQSVSAASSFTNEITLFGDTVSVLVSGYTMDGHVYKLLHGVQEQSNIRFNYSDMTPFQHTITLPPATEGAMCIGYQSDAFLQGTYITAAGQFTEDNYLKKLGYIAGFDRYEMVVQTIQDSEMYVDYRKNGALNLFPTVPTVTAAKIDLSLEHSNVRINRPASFQKFVFGQVPSNPSYTWTVMAPYGKVVKLSEIPAPIIAVYPELKLSEFTFVAAYFTENIVPVTYASFLEQSIQGGPSIDIEAYLYTLH